MAPGGEGSGGGGGGGGGNDKGGSDSAGGDGDEGGGPGSKAARPGGSPSSRCCDASGWAPLLRGGGLKRLAVACALQCLQQLTGINVVLYYASRLFAELGVPPEHAATTLVGVNALLLVLGTVPGLLLVDSPSVGRRRLLVYGGAGMAACHAVVAAALLGVDGAGGGSPAGAAAGWAAVAAMLSFTVVFSATWGPTVWVVQSEIFAGAGERARGGAVATLMNWLSNAILGKVAPLMLTAIGPYTYVVFAATCAGMTAFAATCVPETGGRTLEEMGDVLT